MDPVVNFLLSHGWVGFIILVLLGFGYLLFSDMRHELLKSREIVAELQKARLDDALLRVKDAQALTTLVLDAISTVKQTLGTAVSVLRDRERYDRQGTDR